MFVGAVAADTSTTVVADFRLVTPPSNLPTPERLQLAEACCVPGVDACLTTAPPSFVVVIAIATVRSAERSADAPPPIVIGAVVVIVLVTPTGVWLAGLVVNAKVRSADKSPPPVRGAVVVIVLAFGGLPEAVPVTFPVNGPENAPAITVPVTFALPVWAVPGVPACLTTAPPSLVVVIEMPTGPLVVIGPPVIGAVVSICVTVPEPPPLATAPSGVTRDESFCRVSFAINSGHQISSCST